MGYNVLCERFTHDAGQTYHSHVPSLHGDSRLVDILTYGRVLRSDLLLVNAHEVHLQKHVRVFRITVTLVAVWCPPACFKGVALVCFNE